LSIFLIKNHDFFQPCNATTSRHDTIANYCLRDLPLWWWY